MDEEIKTWLYDILNSIIEIESYFANIPKRFDNYKSDIRTKRAVERNIEIIGEAVNRILKKDRLQMQEKLLIQEIRFRTDTIKFLMM